jgi:hypothetical protein
VTDTDRLAALLHEAIDDCDQVGWDSARTTDLRPEAVYDAVYAALIAAGVTLATPAPLDEERLRAALIASQRYIATAWIEEGVSEVGYATWDEAAAAIAAAYAEETP